MQGHKHQFHITRQTQSYEHPLRILHFATRWISIVSSADCLWSVSTSLPTLKVAAALLLPMQDGIATLPLSLQRIFSHPCGPSPCSLRARLPNLVVLLRGIVCVHTDCDSSDKTSELAILAHAQVTSPCKVRCFFVSVSAPFVESLVVPSSLSHE